MREDMKVARDAYGDAHSGLCSISGHLGPTLGQRGERRKLGFSPQVPRSQKITVPKRCHSPQSPAPCNHALVHESPSSADRYKCLLPEPL